MKFVSWVESRIENGYARRGPTGYARRGSQSLRLALPGTTSETALAYEAGTPTGDGSGIRLTQNRIAVECIGPRAKRSGRLALSGKRLPKAGLSWRWKPKT